MCLSTAVHHLQWLSSRGRQAASKMDASTVKSGRTAWSSWNKFPGMVSRNFATNSNLAAPVFLLASIFSAAWRYLFSISLIHHALLNVFLSKVITGTKKVSAFDACCCNSCKDVHGMREGKGKKLFFWSELLLASAKLLPSRSPIRRHIITWRLPNGKKNGLAVLYMVTSHSQA